MKITTDKIGEDLCIEVTESNIQDQQAIYHTPKIINEFGHHTKRQKERDDATQITQKTRSIRKKLKEK